jgi:hypothetical protein
MAKAIKRLAKKAKLVAGKVYRKAETKVLAEVGRRAVKKELKTAATVGRTAAKKALVAGAVAAAGVVVQEVLKSRIRAKTGSEST